jgi:toxin FitB
LLVSSREDLVPDEGSISVASLAELHLGVHRARDSAERARRLERLGAIEAGFDAIPLDQTIARAWGTLSSACVDRGLNPHARTMDVWIAATAFVLGVPLLTLDRDLAALGDVMDLRVLA